MSHSFPIKSFMCKLAQIVEMGETHSFEWRGEVIDVAKWVFLVKFFGSFQNWNFSNAELETTQKIQLAGVLPTG